MNSPFYIQSQSGKLPWILLILLQICASAAIAAPEFYKNYDEALAAGEMKDKPVILIFSASWCPPCQQMKQSVYPSKEVEPHHDSFIWTYLDVDLPENQGVAQAYRAQGLPHYAFLTADGQFMGTAMGGAPPASFKEILDQVLAHAKTVPPKEKAAPSEEPAPAKEDATAKEEPKPETKEAEAAAETTG